MSASFTKMCSVLIEDNFGPVVGSVANRLMSSGPVSLIQLIRRTNLPVDKVKACLKVLAQHNLLTYKKGSTSAPVPMYSINCEDVLVLIRHPKYLAIAQQIGVEPCHVLEEIVRGGQVTASKVLYIFGFRFLKEKKTNIGSQEPLELMNRLKTYLQAFHTLAARKYIIRSYINPESYTPSLVKPEFDVELFSVPEIDLEEIVSKLGIGESNLNLDNFADSKILWKLNTVQFHDEMKNEILIECLSTQFSRFFQVRDILETLLKYGAVGEQFADETSPVSAAQLEKLPNSEEVDNNVRERLGILVSHSNGVVGEIDEFSGSSFCVNLNLASQVLLLSLVETLIVERHGQNALRVFSVIRTNQYLDQERIAQLSMLPAKDAKQLTYKLTEDNFVILKEMRKSYTASAVNNKVEYCFYVDLPQAAYFLRESCYKAISNARLRAVEEKKRNTRLTGKQDKIQRILVNMVNQGCSEEQLKEIHDLITPPERAVLNRLETILDQLTTVVFHSDTTLLTLKTYFHYLHRDTLRKAKMKE